MRTFKFKLQTVLNHRQKKEDILKKELADLKLKLESEILHLKKLEDKLAQLRNELRSKQQAAFDASEAMSYSAYMGKIENMIEFQILKIKSVEDEVKKAQEKLIEASKEKKILERLKDKKLEEYKIEIEKNEQALIDELSTMRYKKVDQ